MKLTIPSRTSVGPPVPTVEANALIVLTLALRHKLWVYDVVSSLVGLHHMEAAVAPAVERPSEQKIEWLLYYDTLRHIFLSNKVQYAPILIAATRTRPPVLCPRKMVLRVAGLGSCPNLSTCMLPVKNDVILSELLNYHSIILINLSSVFRVQSPQEGSEVIPSPELLC